jgi:two-component system, NtrC family, response regulator AtoC
VSLLADISSFNSNSRFADDQDTIAPFRSAYHSTRSASMRELFKQIEKVAAFDVPVLFLGESGVGKEYFARFLHENSPKSRRPFRKVNCAALPAELLESELFGYERGAFTGATRFKPGQFDLCDQGTILLDEIAEIPPAMQAKLLHVLQDQRFCRLGGRTMVQVDVRVLAATNVDIDEALAQKRLRTDLYYRLNTIMFSIPPLRQRREDIPMLLDQFLAASAAQFHMPRKPLTPRVLEACMQYSWPGNVRELQSFACRFLLREDQEALIAELRETQSGSLAHGESEEDASPLNRSLKSIGRQVRVQAEKQIIEKTLVRTCWNRTEAARLLQISYKSLRSKIRQYEISASDSRPLPADCQNSTETGFGQDGPLNLKPASGELIELGRHKSSEAATCPRIRKSNDSLPEANAESAFEVLAART